METKVIYKSVLSQMCSFFLRVTPELRSGKYDTSRGGGGECEGRVAKYLSIGNWSHSILTTDHWGRGEGGAGAGRAWSGIKGILETNAENEGGEILQKSTDHNNATI